MYKYMYIKYIISFLTYKMYIYQLPLSHESWPRLANISSVWQVNIDNDQQSIANTHRVIASQRGFHLLLLGGDDI